MYPNFLEIPLHASYVNNWTPLGTSDFQSQPQGFAFVNYYLILWNPKAASGAFYNLAKVLFAICYFRSQQKEIIEAILGGILEGQKGKKVRLSFALSC